MNTNQSPISAEWQDFLGHASINPNTPPEIKWLIFRIVECFDDECLEVWAKGHPNELEKIREYANEAGYSELDIDELDIDEELAKFD